MKKLLAILFLTCFAVQAYSDTWNMFNRRLGMFIHWGVYSVGGYHEQEWMKKGLSKADYEKYLPQFTAEHFDPDKFIDVAESLGAEYIVITTKHHDGFCMWNTKTTDFNVMNTPCKRDIIKELSEACKRRNMKLGFYYSIPDWHHSNAWNKLSTHQLKSPNPGDEPDLDKYRAHVKKQITELLTNYGEICCFFWDIPPKIDDPEMNALIRQLQPNIKINNRGWGNEGDYSTPERDFGDWANRKRPYTETCDSVGAQSWGYRENEDYRTKSYLTKNIDRCLCDDSNYLLNIGPKSDGTIPKEAEKLFSSTGAWYNKVKDSFHGQIMTDLVSDKKVKIIKSENYLYLHYPEGLSKTGIDLYPLTTLPKEAILLNTGAKLKVEVVPMTYRSEPSLHIYDIPIDDIPDEPPIIRLELTDVQSAVYPFIGNKEIAGLVSILSDPDYNLTIDCFGYADAVNKRPMTPDTVFAIFSMTKTITGCAIMIAQDRGLLSLNDPVSKYLPEFKDLPYQITIRDCMCHTTGIVGGNTDICKRNIPLREAAAKAAKEGQCKYPPGTKFAYSNTGIDIAAACLEIATKTSFEEFLQKNIFDPLDMRDTTFIPTPDMISRLAKSYTSDQAPFRPATDAYSKQLIFPNEHQVYPAACAGLFSTPRDMTAFSQMIAHHGEYHGQTIISRKTFDEIFSKKQTSDKIEEPYTVGAWLYQDWLGHEGALRTDQRANLKTGHSRLFFIQTENKAGQSFFNAKKAWYTACDKAQGMQIPFKANN